MEQQRKIIKKSPTKRYRTDHQSCSRIICSRRTHYLIFLVLLGIIFGQNEVSDFTLLLRMICVAVARNVKAFKTSFAVFD